MPKGGRDGTTFNRATTIWAMDSGAFTELKQYGMWRMGAVEYAALVNKYNDLVGGLQWASQQDWMCEPVVINGGKTRDGVFIGTGLSVAEHQRKTVDNYLELREICDVEIVPVIQGYSVAEYMECIELFWANGVDLRECKTVGVGSICRRQGSAEIADLLKRVSQMGISAHGFGVKTNGLQLAIDHLVSADSMAWSENAKYQLTHRKGTSCGKIAQAGPNKGKKPIKNCANCYHAALDWYYKIAKLTYGELTCTA